MHALHRTNFSHFLTHSYREMGRMQFEIDWPWGGIIIIIIISIHLWGIATNSEERFPVSSLSPFLISFSLSPVLLKKILSQRVDCMRRLPLTRHSYLLRECLLVRVRVRSLNSSHFSLYLLILRGEWKSHSVWFTFFLEWGVEFPLSWGGGSENSFSLLLFLSLHLIK